METSEMSDTKIWEGALKELPSFIEKEKSDVLKETVLFAMIVTAAIKSNDRKTADAALRQTIFTAIRSGVASAITSLVNTSLKIDNGKRDIPFKALVPMMLDAVAKKDKERDKLIDIAQMLAAAEETGSDANIDPDKPILYC